MFIEIFLEKEQQNILINVNHITEVIDLPKNKNYATAIMVKRAEGMVSYQVNLTVAEVNKKISDALHHNS